MPRGSKACSKCGNVTGPRTKVCPECGAKFAFKPRAMRPIRGREVNWRHLNHGDVIKVTQGSGPYWEDSETGERVGLGEHGIFTVKHVTKDGIHAFPKNGHSHSFIYMGDKYYTEYGYVGVAHKISLIKKKVLHDETNHASKT